MILVTLPASANPEEASQLFEEGRAMLERGDLGQACNRFRESHELDPKVGTVLNLALCEEKRGHVAKALAAWNDAAKLAAELNDERAKVAAERAAQLDPKVPRLTLMPAQLPRDAVVRLTAPNAEPRVIAASELGDALRVDVGSSRIEVEAPGHEGTNQTVTLGEGETKSVELSAGELGESETIYVGDDGDTMRIVGIIVGSVGLVALGVGSGLGLAAKSTNEDSFEPQNAPNPNLCVNADGTMESDACGAEGKALRDDAISLATGSTIAFVAGSVALAAGIVMILVAPSGPDEDADEGDIEVGLAINPLGGAALQMRW